MIIIVGRVGVEFGKCDDSCHGAKWGWRVVNGTLHQFF